MGHWIVCERLPSSIETLREDTLIEADRLYTERLPRVRRQGGSIVLYHEDDPQRVVSSLSCDVPDEDDEENLEELLGYI